jgi:hypothetical protein
MKKKVKKWVRFLFVSSILMGALFLCLTFYFQLKEMAYKKDLEALLLQRERQDEKYNECLAKKYQTNEKITTKLAALDNYIKTNYPYTSIEYYDLNSTLKYTYNDKAVYYGASLIKTLDALYIYNKALEDSSILNEELTYTASFKRASSLGMQNYTFGTKVKIKDLVRYAISVSDNSAHQMLVNYIGFSKLKAYGNSIGNDYTLVGGDNYGSIDLDDAFNYMMELNKYLTNNKELGTELKTYFDNDYDNFLDLDNLNVIHKYGYYGSYFHDIGIAYDTNPYIIVVLTNYGTSNFNKIVNNISKKVNELHEYYYEEKRNDCYIEAYK